MATSSAGRRRGIQPLNALLLLSGEKGTPICGQSTTVPLRRMQSLPQVWKYGVNWTTAPSLSPVTRTMTEVRVTRFCSDTKDVPITMLLWIRAMYLFPRGLVVKFTSTVFSFFLQAVIFGSHRLPASMHFFLYFITWSRQPGEVKFTDMEGLSSFIFALGILWAPMK